MMAQQQYPTYGGVQPYTPLSITQHLSLQQQFQPATARPSTAAANEPTILLRSPNTHRSPPRRRLVGGTPQKQQQPHQQPPYTARSPRSNDAVFPPLSSSSGTHGDLHYSGSSEALFTAATLPGSSLPFVNSSQDPASLSARWNSNMVANASRTSQGAQMLHAPLSPQVQQAMQQHAWQAPGSARGASQPFSPGAIGAANMLHSPSYYQSPAAGNMLHSPSYTGATYYQSPATHVAPYSPYKRAFSPTRTQTQQFPSYPSTASNDALSQLALPPEFVQQQAEKLFRQQLLEQQHAHQNGNGQQQEEKSSRPATAALIHSFLTPPHYPAPGSPTRGYHVPVKYVPARVPDVAYLNMKRRTAGLLAHFKKAAEDDRSDAVQLEMRGSVRFDMSNPKAIFDVAKAQAEKPVEGSDMIFNEKHEVRLKDGTIQVIFGRIHERPDAVKQESISQFFVQRDSGKHMPSLERFVSENYSKDLQKHSRVNRGNAANERKARMERTDEELLASPDEILTPLERWKRDQLKARLEKEKAKEDALKEHRAKQNELLKLRLERERFEREEREKAEKEYAEKFALEEQERQEKEQEKQRLYRELVLIQAEETKQARKEEEERKKREEERKRREEEEARKKRMGVDYVPSFMKPLGSKIQRSPEDEILLARVKDTEKDWAIARAKLKAEIVRLEELLRKRERAAGKRAGITTQEQPDEPSVSTLKDPYEFASALKKLRSAVQGEKNELKDLEAKDAEAKMWYDKAFTAMEAAEARERERERQENMPLQRSGTSMMNKRALQAQTISASPSTQQIPLSQSASTKSMRSDTGAGATEEPTTPGGGTGGGSSMLSPGSPGMSPEDIELRRRRSGKTAFDVPPPHPGTGSPVMKPSSRASGASTNRLPRSPAGRSRAVSPAASRSGSRAGSRAGSRVVSPSTTPLGGPSRRASQDGSHAPPSFDTLRLHDGGGSVGGTSQADLDRRASTHSAMSGVSGVVSPGSATTDDATGTRTPDASNPSDNPEGTESPIVNERTLAIDEARAKMISAQADFEARIKALTSFSTPAGGSGTSGKKKKASSKKGDAKVKSPPPAASKSASGRKKQSILPVFNSPPSLSAAGRSPDASDDEDEETKIAKALMEGAEGGS